MAKIEEQFKALAVNPWFEAAALVVLGLSTLACLGLFLREVWRGSPIELETHWGGFGGGLGGWRLSNSLSYLIAAVIFGLLLTAAAALPNINRASSSGQAGKGNAVTGQK